MIFYSSSLFSSFISYFAPFDLQPLHSGSLQSLKNSSLSGKTAVKEEHHKHISRATLKPGNRNPDPGIGNRNLESGIRNPESGIRNPESGIRNPESGIRNPESGVRNRKPESGIRNPESAIGNPTFINMRTAKFKAQQTNASFTTANQIFGGSYQLLTTSGHGFVV